MPRLLSRALVYAKRSKFLRFGLPFLSFMIIGSFGLSEFTEIRVSIRDSAHGAIYTDVIPAGQKKRREDSLSDRRGVAAVPEEGIYIARHTHTHTHNTTQSIDRTFIPMVSR